MKTDEFEFRNKQGEEIEPTKDQLVIYIKSLHKEIKILNKALELACDKIAQIFESHYSTAWFYDSDENIVERDKFEEYFKNQTKEMMKSE